LEGVYPKTGLASAHVGVAWQPVPLLSLRAGYRTDTTQNLSALAGFSTGLGLTLWGQELSYAWVPYGDLGASNYISLVMRFGGSAKERNLITYQRHAVAKASPEVKDPETETLKELLSSLDSAEEVAHAK
jgi:hypothetical protein